MDVDISEFEGNIEEFKELIQKKINQEIIIRKNILQIDKLSASKIRDILKQTLHKIEPHSYNVTSKSGSFKIKKIKNRSNRRKEHEGTPPSAPQSMPYFFPR